VYGVPMNRSGASGPFSSIAADAGGEESVAGDRVEEPELIEESDGEFDDRAEGATFDPIVLLSFISLLASLPAIMSLVLKVGAPFAMLVATAVAAAAAADSTAALVAVSTIDQIRGLMSIDAKVVAAD
jgi:hypothetical protein